MTTVNFGHDRARHGGDELGAVAGDAAVLVLAADHEAGDVLQEDQRDAALVAQLDEVGALERRLAEQDPVVGDDADLVPPDVGEAGHQRLAVELLELVEPAAVDDPADHLADVVRRAGVGRVRRQPRSPGPRAAPPPLRPSVEEGAQRPSRNQAAMAASPRSTARSPARGRRRRPGGRPRRTSGRARRRRRAPRP